MHELARVALGADAAEPEAAEGAVEVVAEAAVGAAALAREEVPAHSPAAAAAAAPRAECLLLLLPCEVRLARAGEPARPGPRPRAASAHGADLVAGYDDDFVAVWRAAAGPQRCCPCDGGGVGSSAPSPVRAAAGDRRGTASCPQSPTHCGPARLRARQGRASAQRRSGERRMASCPRPGRPPSPSRRCLGRPGRPCRPGGARDTDTGTRRARPLRSQIDRRVQ
jgi:hypothetical protein